MQADAIAKRLMNTPNSGNNIRRRQRVNRNRASPTDVLNMIKMASTHCVLSRTARNGRHSESSFVRIKQGRVNNLQLATATHIRHHDDWAILSILQRSIVRHEKLTWLGVGGPEGATRVKSRDSRDASCDEWRPIASRPGNQTNPVPIKETGYVGYQHRLATDTFKHCQHERR